MKVLKRSNGVRKPTYHPPQHQANSCSTRNSKEQREKLKTMLAAERENILCKKCGEYFHSAKDCTRPGKVCYNCNEYGHISKDCKKQQRKKGNFNENDYINDVEVINVSLNSTHEKLEKISVLIDSAASHHIVYDCDLLENYKRFIKRKLVTTALAQNGESIGEGNLSIILKFDNEAILYLLFLKSSTFLKFLIMLSAVTNSISFSILTPV